MEIYAEEIQLQIVLGVRQLRQNDFLLPKFGKRLLHARNSQSAQPDKRFGQSIRPTPFPVDPIHKRPLRSNNKSDMKPAGKPVSVANVVKRWFAYRAMPPS